VVILTPQDIGTIHIMVSHIVLITKGPLLIVLMLIQLGKVADGKGVVIIDTG
jgi:hypothetical protein